MKSFVVLLLLLLQTTTATATVNANSTSPTTASKYNLSTGKQLEGFYHEAATEGVDLVTEISHRLPTAHEIKKSSSGYLFLCFFSSQRKQCIRGM